ncbi:hypothetical protein CPB83DRAFT_849264 [Crepidotus variabilis]|uniref:DUF6534 domain-containing protein n=1 Tax=Crepidotus variabilis TaxID=179855 RepID=A0A9P6EJV5_9AGAR|nr:hypothetical protein CPB83DRAFT_849264 [Crepidotus variabilis]
MADPSAAVPNTGAPPPGMMPLQMPAFDNTLGALLLGGLVAMALWGIACVQAYNYYTRPNKDRMLQRIVVGSLWLLDTFDTALNVHILYFYMVSNFMNPLALLKPVWSIIIHVAMTAISNFAIRSMFALRIYRFSNKNIPLTIWVMGISLTDLIVSLIITVKAFSISFPELSTISSLMYLTFAVGTGSDLTVALSLSWLLRSSRTGFRRTDSMIKVLMLYAVNTGMIVAIDASLGMILYIVMPDNLIFLGFYLLLSKLYLNSYLATLNARQSLREGDSDLVSINLSQLSGSRRYEAESTLPTLSEKTSATVTRSNSNPTSTGMEISVSTLVDKKVESYPLRNQDHLHRAY